MVFQARVSFGADGGAIKPIVLITERDIHKTNGSLAKLLEEFKREDDVFTDEFEENLEHLIIRQPTDDSSDQPKEPSTYSVGETYQHLAVSELKSSDLPHGPYFLCGNAIHQAWRLYADNLDSFISTVIPKSVADVQSDAYEDHLGQPSGIESFQFVTNADNSSQTDPIARSMTSR